MQSAPSTRTTESIFSTSGKNFDFEEEEEGKEKLAGSTAKDIRSRFISGPFVIQSREEMVTSSHPLAGQLRIQAVKAKWAALREEAGRRRHTLESATDAYLFFSDCNETDSVIKESVTLAKSKDFGQDKLTAMSLLQRHKQVFRNEKLGLLHKAWDIPIVKRHHIQ